MNVCPTCGTTLQRKQSDYGVFWACEKCGNWLISLPILRRTLETSFFNSFWQAVRASGEGQGAGCPLCQRPMNQVSAGNQEAPLTLTVCKACNVSWLSPGERSILPAQAPAEPTPKEAPNRDISSLPLEAARLAALHQVELIGERAKNENQFDASHLPLWQKILAIVGMPIEETNRADSKFPWFTTLTVLATLGISLYFFMDRRSPDYYGFIPREFDRNGGLTFLSSFFVHGGWVHLLTNMYFLFVFGRVVEDKIGGWLFLILLTLSTASGNILTLCFEPQSDIPHVGASGGIAGVLIFYGLTFPRNKIVFFMAGTYGLMMPRLIRIPAWAALLLWVLIQFFGACFQSAGMSTVSYSSHLGGLGLGLAFWLLWKWITGGRQGRDRGYNDPKSGKGASK